MGSRAAAFVIAVVIVSWAGRCSGLATLVAAIGDMAAPAWCASSVNRIRFENERRR